MNKKNIFNNSMNTSLRMDMPRTVVLSDASRLTLNVWVPEDYDTLLQQIINENSIFDADINLHAIPVEELEMRVAVAMNSGDMPDLILTTDDRLVKIVELDPSSFLRLEDYFDPNSFSNFKLGELMQLNGEIYGIPFSGGPVAYYYNEDLFDAAGVSLHDNMTWDEFFEVGRKLLDNLNLLF